MHSASRGSFRAALRALAEVLRADIDPQAVADEVFAVTALLDRSSALRRVLADPSRGGDAKRDLVDRVLGGKVNGEVLHVVKEAVSGRWSQARDLTDCLEVLAVDAQFAAAARHGRLDQAEDDLFRFERFVAGNEGLRTAFADRAAPAAARADLATRLLADRTGPEVITLVRQAVLAPRGRSLTATITEFLDVAARRRDRQSAVVTSAIPLDHTQRQRLATALERIYGHAVQVNVVVDPDVVGGIHVRVGDEVVDGTIVRRIEDARRAMGG